MSNKAWDVTYESAFVSRHQTVYADDLAAAVYNFQIAHAAKKLFSVVRDVLNDKLETVERFVVLADEETAIFSSRLAAETFLVEEAWNDADNLKIGKISVPVGLDEYEELEYAVNNF